MREMQHEDRSTARFAGSAGRDADAPGKAAALTDYRFNQCGRKVAVTGKHEAVRAGRSGYFRS